MRRIYGEELKKIQLTILDVVDSFCDANEIKYWLDSGTLLGAIRHKGYIPWDDDIDLGMLRDDFDKFMRLFNIENERYKIYCVENNKNFYYPYGKVLDTETILYEPDINGNKLSINIDIFVYENAPVDNKELKKMYNRRDILRLLHSQRIFNYAPNGNLVRKIVIKALRAVLRLFPKHFFVEKMSKNSKRYYEKKCDLVGDFTGYTRMTCNKRVFDSFIETEFEGKFYKIPIGYDEWLRSFYGDYMQLPPIEERVSHHKYEAYVID